MSLSRPGRTNDHTYPELDTDHPDFAVSLLPRLELPNLAPAVLYDTNGPKNLNGVWK